MLLTSDTIHIQIKVQPFSCCYCINDDLSVSINAYLWFPGLG